MTLKLHGAPEPVTIVSPVPVQAAFVTPVPVLVDSDQISAFDRVRVVAPTSVADLVNKYQLDPEDYVVTVDGGAKGSVTHLPLQSAAQLAVSDGTNGAFAQLQTKDYYRYQAGRGLVWLTTAMQDDACHANQRREWGRFDDQNGIFFRLQGGTCSLVRRSYVTGAVVDTVVAQAAWNVDPMDGTGPSGETMNLTYGHIFEVRRMQWLGVGDVAVYVDGHPVHVFHHKGVVAVPYMQTAQLPMTWRIENVGAAAAGSFRYVCAHVGIEGAVEVPVHPYAYSMPASVNCLNGVEKPLFSIRPKAAFPVGGPANRAMVLPTTLHVSSESHRGAVRLVWNPTSLTNSTWAVAGEAQSGVEIDTAATAVVGGSTLLRPFCPQDEGINVDISRLFGRFGRRMRQAGDGSRDVLTVVGVGEAAPSSDIRCTLVWDEVR